MSTQTIDIQQAKEKLDILINKQRVALYKPIQIAEILYRFRKGELSINNIRTDIETYRNPSKRWRDEVTRELINQVSTSSQKFQDNLFESNAISPGVLAVLAEHNNQFTGVVERYIYQKFRERQNKIFQLNDMLSNATPQNFHLSDFLTEFTRDKGIKRSIDKAYEIVVYALFDTLVKQLRVTITIQADESQRELLREFEEFSQLALGIDSQSCSITVPARLYRAGVTNAADRDIDIWANFGPAIQVKHLTLTEDLAEDICDEVTANRIVIVCKDCEQDTIERFCHQLGLDNRIQGIITQNHLIAWYEAALRGKFAFELGNTLLESLRNEFCNEFPYNVTFDTFYTRRGYHTITEPSSIFWQKDSE
jgi:type II restriction enzyme